MHLCSRTTEIASEQGLAEPLPEAIRAFSSSPAGNTPRADRMASPSWVTSSIHIDASRYVDRYIDRRQYDQVKRLIQTIDAECCPQVLAEPLDEDEADRLAAALRVLADPARLRLLSILGAHPNGESCVCELTGPIGLSQPTVSHHLKVLTDAGLVGRERRGRWVYYWVLPEPIELLRGALAAPVSTERTVA